MMGHVITNHTFDRAMPRRVPTISARLATLSPLAVISARLLD